MINKIDIIDKRLIYELDNNSRIPLNSLAKTLRIHRNVLEYRMKRLVAKKVIRGFLTAIRPSAFGYKHYKIYIKLNNFTKEREEEIVSFFYTLPLSVLYKTTGCWDYVVGIYVKDIQQLNKVRYDIQVGLPKELADMKISSTVEVYQYRKNYLIDKKEELKPHPWISNYHECKVDRRDLHIIRHLINNSRISAADIAKRVGLSLKTTLARIKNLRKKEVIYDYRLGLNPEVMGIKFYKCLAYLKNLEKGDRNAIKAYCNLDPNITYLVECIADWDFEVDMEIESEEAFTKKLEEMRFRFSKIIKDIQILKIEKEFYLSGLPPFMALEREWLNSTKSKG